MRRKFPSSTVFFNQRIGSIPEKLQGYLTAELSPNIAKPWNRYADAIVIDSGKLIIIEAKLPADVAAVAQLEFYQGLVRQTPELKQYAELPIELVLVTALPDPALVAFAESKKITVDLFQPEYAIAYLSNLLKGKVIPVV